MYTCEDIKKRRKKTLRKRKQQPKTFSLSLSQNAFKAFSKNTSGNIIGGKSADAETLLWSVK